MLLLVLIYVVLMALWKIDVYLISTLVNKSLYYYLLCNALSIIYISQTITKQKQEEIEDIIRMFNPDVQ